MVAALYDHGRNEFLNGNIDWVNDDIGVALVDTGTYTVDLANDQDMADVSGIVAQSPTPPAANDTIANKTATAGVADGDDYVLSSVSGATIEAMILYKNTGVAANDTLIAYLDQNDVTGLPLTPNGGDVTIAWDSGANKIFKL
jgi:hypothetical protein